MRRRMIQIARVVLVLSGVGSAVAGAARATDDLKPLVSTEWLAQNLHDPGLVVLYVGGKDGYVKGHIPGARHVSVRRMLTFGPDSLRDEMPPVTDLAAQLAELGISNRSRVVIGFEEAKMVSSAARVFLTLEYLGLRGQVAMLDGGLPKWIAEKRPLSTDTTAAAPARFRPGVRPDVLVSGEWVAANLQNPRIALVDARPVESYDGRGAFQHDPRSGHIPGALNIPVSVLQAERPDYLLKSIPELRKAFRDAGVRDDATVVAYCGTGIWAATVYLAARMLGYPTRFYDAGFQEWSRDVRFPVTAPVNPGALR